MTRLLRRAIAVIEMEVNFMVCVFFNVLLIKKDVSLKDFMVLWSRPGVKS
jgi:hypothetical protein